MHLTEIHEVINNLPYEEKLNLQTYIEQSLVQEESTRVGKFFDETEKSLYLKFRGWENDIPHSGEMGGLRERRVADFLSLILPKKYGIGTGHIIDNQGNISRQTDIIIYDALEGIVLPADDYYSLFPCECVYATIEVKSTLSMSDGTKGPKGSIYDCLVNTSQMKSLKRNNKHHQLPPIISIVFSYQTIKNRTKKPHEIVMDKFEYLSEKYEKNMPDMIYVLKPGFLIYPLGSKNLYGKDKKLAVIISDSLLGFTTQLIRVLSETQVATPNLWYEYEYIRKKEGNLVAEIHSPQLREKRRSAKSK